MASLITALGGTPAIIAFDDTRNALANGLVDCAITSAASANYAGWAEHSQAYFPLAAHFGLNGYAISLKKWNQFSQRQQKILQDAFDAYLEDLWSFSQAIHADASSCNIGGDCQWGKPYRMALVEHSPHDSQRLKALSQTLLLPEWAEKCERIHPGCRREWEAKVLDLVP